MFLRDARLSVVNRMDTPKYWTLKCLYQKTTKGRIEIKAEIPLISAKSALLAVFLLCFPPFPLIFSGFLLYIPNWEWF
jgi:hypothetical protein